MSIEKYLANYPVALINQAQSLVDNNELADFFLKRYPKAHGIANDSDLRAYVIELKKQYMQKSAPLSKVVYDNKLQVVHHALGLHTYVSRVQGSKLKSKNEIRIGGVFRKTPEPFLNMIVVHELAHLKEKDHNKSFYKLCEHMLPDYHQLELHVRLYLVQLDSGGALYS